MGEFLVHVFPVSRLIPGPFFELVPGPHQFRIIKRASSDKHSVVFGNRGNFIFSSCKPPGSTSKIGRFWWLISGSRFSWCFVGCFGVGLAVLGGGVVFVIVVDAVAVLVMLCKDSTLFRFFESIWVAFLCLLRVVWCFARCFCCM